MLVLRGSLGAGARREYQRTLAGGLHRDDAWQRAIELLFERLAASWTIAGLELTGQKELLARYRMASGDERAFVRGSAAGASRGALPRAGGAVSAGWPDPDAFATLLCDWCLGVEPGHQVLVVSTTLAVEPVAAMYRAVLERGAWPLLRLTPPESAADFYRLARTSNSTATRRSI